MKEENKKFIIQALRKRIEELMKEKDILLSYIDDLHQDQKFGALKAQQSDTDVAFSQFSLK